MNFLQSAVNLALLFRLSACEDVAGKTLIGAPSNLNNIIYEEAITNQLSAPLRIRSDVPLSIHRFDYYDYFQVYPIEYGDGMILVSSTCDVSESAVPNVVLRKGAGGVTFVDVELGVTPQEASQMPFLQSSSYDAWWVHPETCWWDTADPTPQFTRPPPTEGGSTVTSPCLKEADCDEMRQRKGISAYSTGPFPSKGCFEKSGKAFWGTGGSEDEIRRTDLPGVQERIWCEAEVSLPGEGGGATCMTQKSCDEKRSDLGMTSFQAGDYQTKGCFTKNGKAYWGKGGSADEKAQSDLPGVQERIWCGQEVTGQGKDSPCLTKEACDQRRQEMGMSSFQSGDYPTKGCFSKNGNAFFSEGSPTDMSMAELPGVQQRIWCKGASSINSAVQQESFNTLSGDENSVATSSAFLSRPFVLGSLVSAFAKADTFSPRSRKLQSCTYNVEVLLHGCDGLLDPSSIQVESPKARVINPVLMGANEEKFKVNNKWYYEHSVTLTFPNNEAEVFDVLSKGYTNVPPPDEERCAETVCGRPFVDSNGKSLLASPREVNECGGTPSWSVSATVSGGVNNSEVAQDPPSHNSTEQSDLGGEWMRNALGEHASVASFAAFTIALMTNRAPSDLVEDSLNAAMDEVRHAKISFEIASKLLGKEVGPGPLPPSSHEFSHNLTALAISVAKEGCVDETMSALAAAVEVEVLDKVLENGAVPGMKYSATPTQVLTWIRDELRTISMDESNHSALAWRTLGWVCTVDEDACTAAKSSVLDKHALNAAVQRRFGRGFEAEPKLSDQVMAFWVTIRAGLKALQNNASFDQTGGPEIAEGGKGGEASRTDSNKSLLFLLAENISRRGVYLDV